MVCKSSGHDDGLRTQQKSHVLRYIQPGCHLFGMEESLPTIASPERNQMKSWKVLSLPQTLVESKDSP